MNEIFVLLVEAGTDLMATTGKEGMNVLHLCARTKETPLRKIKALLDHGIEVNTPDRSGRTALHYAVRNGNLDIIQLLLQKGSDIFCQDYKGCIALMGVAASNDVALKMEGSQFLLVRSMLNQMDSANVSELINFQDEEGWTILHHAVSERYLKLVHELLDWGADVTAASFCHGNSALHLAVSDGRRKNSGNLSMLRCLLEHKNGYNSDNVNLQDDNGWTALHLAVCCKNLPVVEFLSQIIDVRIRNADGDTALHAAVTVRYRAPQQIIDLLLCGCHGAEAANLVNKKGKTALHDAILGGNIEAVLAIGKVADVNVVDKYGRTALHYAIQDHQIHFVDMLLGRMIDVSVRDHQGQTALGLACSIECSEENAVLSIIFHLCRHGIAYGELQNML